MKVDTLGVGTAASGVSGSFTATGAISGGTTIAATGALSGGSISTAGTLSAAATTVTTLTASGNVTTTANVGVGTASPGNKLTVSSSAALDGIHVTDGTRWMKLMPGTVGSGSYNGIVSANDNAIIYSGGAIGTGGFTIAPWASATTGLHMDAAGNVGVGTASPGKPLDVAGVIRSNNEITGTMAGGYGQFRAVSGNYGAFIRNDGSDTYMPLLTASGDQYGVWNTLRPLRINNASGDVVMANSQVTISHATGNISAASLTLGTPLAVAQGGTGGNTQAAAQAALNVPSTTGAGASGTWPISISGSGSSIAANSIPIASINATGTRDATTYLRGDATWAPITTSQWVNGTAGAIYYNGGNVGIGTSTPGYPLHVYGNINGNYVAGVQNASTHGFVSTATTYGIVGYATSAGGNGVLGQNTSTTAYGVLGAATNGVSGITTSLSGHGVSGTGAASGSSSYGVFASAGSYNAGLARADGYSFVGTGTLYNNGAISQVNGATPNYFAANVGIGTASPAQKLDVNGYIQVDSINGEGGTIKMMGNNGVNLHLENINGTFRMLNSAWSADIFAVDQSGIVNVRNALYVAAGLNLNGKLVQVGPAGDWAQVINWGPGSVNGYGILVGSGAGKYSQFQNAEGYYTMLANTSWGVYSNGNMGGANFYHVSDRRLKDNIKQSAGLDLVMKMKGVSFTWKKDGTKSDGVIAQEIEEVMPEAVATDPKGFKTVNYDVMFAPIIESIKELKSMLDKMGEKLAQLFTRVDAHDAELKALHDEMKKLQGEFTAYKAAHP
ncbi:MAG: tail fiber domain-containing protein, partial [Alphaproteobacteria bacterium]|nr:tail fiber domain-containing protein [Alphaproteobacteria bacterium]